MARLTTWLTLLVAVLALVVGVLAFQWWRGEERVIRARLDNLAETLSPSAGGELAMVGRIAQLRNHFAPDVRIRFGADEIVSREALLALLGRWEPPAAGFSLQFVDVTVTMTDDLNAQVTLTARISNRDQRTGEAIVDAREASLTMRKMDGEWVVAAVESANTLERP
jgi:hypothetical protein